MCVRIMSLIHPPEVLYTIGNKYHSSMKQTDIELKKGDRVWVQEYDYFGDPLRLRFAEVLGMIHMPIGSPPQVALRYLDGNRKYECVSVDRIKEYCKKEEF